MAVSDTPWSNFKDSDYTPEQYKRACLIDSGQGDPDSKERYKLPVREPGGALNRNGVHAAAGRVNQVQPASKRAAAARKLIALYRNDLHEDPPDSLTKLGERSAQPAVERLYTTSWSDVNTLLEVRSMPDGKPSRVIGGYAAVFGKRSQPLGGYREIVEPSFFNKSRSDQWPGVVCRFEHNPLMLLGTSASGTLQLSTDNVGLDYQVNLPESRSDVYESVQRGDIRSSSFAFQAYEDDWKPNEGGYPIRHLVSGRLIDVAPTAVPAYPDASVALRSLALARNADFDEVEVLAEQDNLRVLFIRTDNRDKREPMSEERTAAVADRDTEIHITVKPGSGSGGGARVEPEVKSGPEQPEKVEPEVKSEPEPEKPEPEVKPEPEPEVKAEVKAEPEPEKVEPQPEPPGISGRLAQLLALKNRPDDPVI